MGEVYRARDTRLGRDVAVKVLPTHLSDSTDLKARFEREAKAISQLSHPHICALYDVGSHEGTEYLVMELLEGQTLAGRLEKGPLPTEQVLKFGTEIADALDKAHRHGIIHRDLKPGNVMLTKSGVKLLDFGLAKTLAPNRAEGLSSLPTEAERPLTEKGTIMGTFQYMAPEQLEGKEADPRTDIFAFGAVLHEMATGRKAFSGASRASLIGAIMNTEPPPISSVQPMTPPALDHVVHRCLAKEPDDRWQSAADVANELKWVAEAGSQAGAPATVVSRRKSRERFTLGLLVGLSALFAASAVLLIRTLSRAENSEGRVIHAQLHPPKGERIHFLFLSGNDRGRSFAVSPDGTRVVFVVRSGATSKLLLASLDQDAASPLPGTEGSIHPFFSPDGRWIGFSAGPKLKKIALSGGAPVVLADAPGFRGAAWGEDGFIYFTPDQYREIDRVPAEGGEAKPVTRIHASEGEQQHRWVDVVPGTNTILYAVGSGFDWDEAKIFAERIDTGARKVVVRGGTFPRYLPGGTLVFERGGSLFAVAFDARSLATSGSPVEVAKGVFVDGSGFAQMDFSRNGLLVTASSEAAAGGLSLSWINRDGRGEPLPVPKQDYNFVALSPDGSRAALGIGNSISTLDLSRNVLTRLTTSARAENPVYSSDARKLYFGLEKEKYYKVFSKDADDSGPEALLFASEASEYPMQVSADGRWMLTSLNLPSGEAELRLRRLDAAGANAKPLTLIRSQFFNNYAVFSADARWVAYQSEESGRPEIYVRPACREERRFQISPEGGTNPIWSHDGKEIFYLCGAKFVSVPVAIKEGEVHPGAPKALFENHEILVFDADRAGQRFLAAENPNFGAETKLILVVNWFAEVKRKLREAKAP
jgi:serine/threonine-protein kinase